MELEIGTFEYDYYPDFLDNAKKKTVVAKLKMITTGELEGAINPANPGMVDRKAVVEAGLKELQGLKVNGKEIKTVEDILATPKLFGLYVDLFVEINSKGNLTQEEIKN